MSEDRVQHLKTVIERYLRDSGTTAHALSRKAGLNDRAVGQILEGRSRSPRGSTLISLAKAMDMPVQLLLDFGGDIQSEVELKENVLPSPEQASLVRPAGPVDVPVYGVGEGGADGFFEINIADGPIDYVERPSALAHTTRVFAFFVVGSSMEPVWEAGDKVYVVPGWPILTGSYVLITLEARKGDHPRALIKRFLRQDSDKVVLQQFNPYQEVEVERRQVRDMWRALHWRDLLK